MHLIFDQYKVDFCLSGHNHNYERTYPVAYKAKVTDTHKADYMDPPGQVFANIGSGGRVLYEMDAQEPYVLVQYGGHGHMKLGMRDNGTRITAQFIASSDKKVKDEFSITKQ
jgi:hypothetical protein